MFQAPKKVTTNLVNPTHKSQQDFRRSGSSVIGSDLTIKGDVQSDGPLIINGKVQGDVKSRTLTVKEGGIIEGNVAADEVMIFGKVFGTIQARELRLRPSSHVEGDILHEQLEIEMGTSFSGKLTRTPFTGEVGGKEVQEATGDIEKDGPQHDNPVLHNRSIKPSTDNLAQAS